MGKSSLGERKEMARVFVSLATPLIDGFLRVARRISIYARHTPQEIAEIAAPRFVELILIYDAPEWPDYPELVLAEVKGHIIKQLSSTKR